MSGLLAKLVARAQGTLPAVAPRPVSRFEDVGAAGDLAIEEAVLEQVTPPPKPVPTQAATPTAPMPPAMPLSAATPLSAEQRVSPPPAIPPPSIIAPVAEPADPAPPVIPAPDAPPPRTLRQVEHHERRIEREVHHETVQTSAPVSGVRPQVQRTEPLAPEPAPVAPARLVEIIERITGHAPVTEPAPDPVPAPQPSPLAVPAAATAPPARRDVQATAARPTPRLSPEPAAAAPVHVHIDRIEVRTTPAPKPRAIRTRQPTADTAPSLQAFLAGNKAGGP